MNKKEAIKFLKQKKEEGYFTYGAEKIVKKLKKDDTISENWLLFLMWEPKKSVIYMSEQLYNDLQEAAKDYFNQIKK